MKNNMKMYFVCMHANFSSQDSDIWKGEQMMRGDYSP
jgi:hypothetical protein